MSEVFQESKYMKFCTGDGTTCKQNTEAQLNVANNKNSNTIFDKIKWPNNGKSQISIVIGFNIILYS